jgi:hypothetical protein
MKLGSIQPSYLSWIPFFQRMAISDVFVYLDDVEYSKNSFHNRNRIRSKSEDLLLTVPIQYSGNSKAFISEIKYVDSKLNKWKKKHWDSIVHCYSKSPFFNEFEIELREILFSEWDSLASFNIAIIELFKNYIGISTLCVRSSDYPTKLTNNEKLIELCQKLGANEFIVKPNTYDYHPKEIFQESQIEFVYFTPKKVNYNQFNGDFIPNLSILDFAANVGSNSINYLL